MPNWGITLISVTCLLVAYACSLYAIGRVTELLPEIYKFGSTMVDVSRSTVRLWGALSFVCIAVAWLIYRAVPSMSRPSRYARATIGAVVCTSVIFIPFLFSPYVGYRL